MTYQLSATEKAAIRQEVLDDIKEKRLAGWVNVDKMCKKRIADREHKAKKNALRKEGKLTFKDLIRFR